jgi:hypothetical protein
LVFVWCLGFRVWCLFGVWGLGFDGHPRFPMILGLTPHQEEEEEEEEEEEDHTYASLPQTAQTSALLPLLLQKLLLSSSSSSSFVLRWVRILSSRHALIGYSQLNILCTCQLQSVAWHFLLSVRFSCMNSPLSVTLSSTAFPVSHRQVHVIPLIFSLPPLPPFFLPSSLQ